MESMERTKHVRSVTEETKNAIVKNSVQALGNQPAMSAAEMKKQFVKPVVNGDGTPSAIGEIDRVAAETEEALDEVARIVVAASEGIEEAKKALVDNVTGLQHADSVIRESVASLNNQVNESVAQLEADSKAMQDKLRNVEHLAKQGKQALSYGNYSTLIATFNVLSNTAFNVGQDLYIITVGVPDLWISGIEEENEKYTYITDTDFVSALRENGYVKVGYYKLSELETGKVDMSDYEPKAAHEADIKALEALLPTVERLD